MTSVSPTRPPHVSLLVEEDRPGLREFLDEDRVGNLYLRSILHEFGISPTEEIRHGRLYGARRAGRFTAVCFMGNARNFTTAGDVSDVIPLMERCAGETGRPRLFIGPAEHAGVIREAFARNRAFPHLDRAQAYYALTPETLAELPELEVRPARAEELEPVANAHATMTEEDLQIPRASLDEDRLREICRERIGSGKVWVHMDGPRLVFKTEEAARAEDGILVGGVFTDPWLRGQGFAARGIATWARSLFAGGLSMLTLHVNADNLPAVRSYERVGFRRHAMLRLMLAY